MSEPIAIELRLEVISLDLQVANTTVTAGEGDSVVDGTINAISYASGKLLLTTADGVRELITTPAA